MRFLLLLFLLAFKISDAQIIPEYSQDFDSVSLTGWSSYSSSGSTWERGVSTGKTYLTEAYSLPNAYYTNLNGTVTPLTYCLLQTPAFDLSNTSIIYYLAFTQRRGFNSSSTSGVQYSLNNGANWTNLNNAASNKKNWSITGTSNHNPIHSAHSLDFLSGQSNVIFRFYFSINNTSGLDGWMIDNFIIGEEYFYLSANNGTPIKNVSEFTTQLTIASNVTVTSPYGLGSGLHTTRFYYSNDSILDANDTLMLEQAFSSTSFSYSVPMPVPIVNPGKKYIIHEHDVYNVIAETIENYHKGFTRIEIDSTYPTPFREDFEGNNIWKRFSHNAIGGGSASTINNWKIKESYVGSEEIFEGNKSLHHDQFEVDFNAIYEFIQSPFIDLNPAQPNSFCYWYKLDNRMIDNTTYGVKFGSGIANTTYPYYSFTPTGTNNVATTTPRMERLWDCKCVGLGSQEFMKFHFSLATNAYFQPYLSFLSYDRIYVGKSLPDLTIENKTIQLTTSNTSLDTLNYMIFNGGGDTIPSTTTKFYWSTDSLFDMGDIYLGSNTESTFLPNGVFSSSGVDYMYTTFEYNKPTLTPGIYYVFYQLDADSLYEESWEDNNLSYFKISQQNIPTLPYENDFETEIDGWYHEIWRFGDKWEWGTPNGIRITEAFSGNKGIHTIHSSLPDSVSKSDLYTPPFDLSQLTDPVMEFELDFINNGSYMPSFDYLNMNYSTDGGKSWRVLDTTDYFKRWTIDYEYEDYYGNDRITMNNTYESDYFKVNEKERTFMSNIFYGSRDTRDLTKFSIDLHELGDSLVWFRFNHAHPSSGNGDEILIDDFKIRNRFVNLTMDYSNKIFINPNSSEFLQVDFSILNSGNTKVNSSVVQVWISADSILDGADVMIAATVTPEIHPYMLSYLKLNFNIPALSFTPNYLLFKLDPQNLIAESDENDNLIVWEVDNAINNFPYLEEFEEIYNPGWFSNLSNPSSFKHRMGTILPPDKNSTRNPTTSGFVYSNYLNQTASVDPDVINFYSPVFDLSASGDLLLSADLFSYGQNNCERGGNVEFTIDGGTTWNVLTDDLNDSYNWYNCSSIVELGNKPGWYNNDNTGTRDSVAINISYLVGNSNVRFRFRYYGRGMNYKSPFTMDNFRLSGLNSDLEALTQGVILPPETGMNPVFTQVSVKNNNPNYASQPYKIAFWWSTDSNFDASSDEFLIDYSCLSINSLNTDILSYALDVPQSVQTGTYYLYYLVDSDSTMHETNEVNNFGYFIVDFTTSIDELSQDVLMYYFNESIWIKSNESINGTFTLNDIAGKTIYQEKKNIETGSTQISCPTSIASGVYIGKMHDENGNLVSMIKFFKK
jgi:hypothetical protein